MYNKGTTQIWIHSNPERSVLRCLEYLALIKTQHSARQTCLSTALKHVIVPVQLLILTLTKIKHGVPLITFSLK